MIIIIKYCKFCNKEIYNFGKGTGRRIVCDDCNIIKEINCDYCNKSFMPSKRVYRSFLEHNKVGCCTSCITHLCKDKIMKTLLENQGEDYFSNHAKRYWDTVDTKSLNIRNNKISNSYNNKSQKEKDEIKNSIKNTQIEKYGCFAFNTEKQKQTMIEKYGVDHNWKRQDFINYLNEQKWSKEAREKRNKYWENIKKENEEKWNKLKKDVIEFCFNFEINNKRKPHIQDALTYFENYEFNIYRTSFNNFINSFNLREYFIIKESYFEKIVEDWLIKYNINYKKHDRSIIKPLELDFYLKEFNIAIEVNDTNTHNCTKSSYSFKNNFDPYYHYNKTQLCKENGIKVIHLFEKDLINLDVYLSVLLPKQRIYARNCEIKECNVKEFLNKYHRQQSGNIVNGIGLFYNNELIQVISFRKVRNNSKGDYELYRLCSKSNYIVVGGASKLLTFWENKNPKMKIISYCDLTYNSGNVYEQLGFKLHHYSGLNYKWVKDNLWLTREYCQRHKLNKLFNKQFDNCLTETDIMELEGFVKVYDCGNNVYVKE